MKSLHAYFVSYVSASGWGNCTVHLDGPWQADTAGQVHKMIEKDDGLKNVIVLNFQKIIP